MGISSTVIPGGLDANSTDDVTIDTNDENKIRIKPSYEEDHVFQPTAINALEILELVANDGSITPNDHDSMVVELFSDADGYNDYVNTGESTAQFSTNKYVRTGATIQVYELTSGAVAQNVGTDGGGNNHLKAQSITLSQSTKLTDVSLRVKTILGTGQNIRVSIQTDSSGEPSGTLADADLEKSILNTTLSVGADNTFTFPNGGATLSAGDYWIVIEAPGVSGTNKGIEIWMDNANAVPTSLAKYSTDGGSTWTSGTGLYDYWMTLNGIDGVDTDRTVVIDLPTITGTVTHTALIVKDVDRESGDAITYDITDGSATDSSLALETKNAFTNLTGNPTKLTINLEKKETGATDGVPSVRSMVLKLWKS